MDKDFWSDNEKEFNVVLLLVILINVIMQIAIIFSLIKTNIKIEEIEHNNLQAHENILDRIGG